MNKIFFTLLAALTVFTVSSCKKKKSGDPPLSKDRVEAVYVGTDNNNLIAFDAYKGVKLFEVMLTGTCKGTPVLYDKKVYVHTDGGFLYSIDVVTGKIHNSVATLFPSHLALIAHNGRIYIAGDKLYCYDTLLAQQWAYDGGAVCSSSPQLINDKIFLGIGDKVHCVDLAGNNVWSGPAITGGVINSSPRVSEGVVYYGAQDKIVYAINESDGSPAWNYTTLDKVESSPLIYGGMCLIGSTDYNLYCIDTITGLLRWKYLTAERVNSSPIVHEATNTILVGSYDFNLYAIDHVSGTLKWKYPAGSLIKTSPVIFGVYTYFTSYDKYLYCVDIRDGRLVWKQFMNANSQGSPIIDDFGVGKYSTESGMSIF